MILTEQTAGLQMTNTKWTHTTYAEVINPATEESMKDVCLCAYECEFKELVLVNINDETNSYENDYRKFLVNPSLNSSSYTFYLVKNGVEILFSTDYGDVYVQGFNLEQDKQAGIKVDWVKVAKKEGYGEYKIKTELIEMGKTISTTSHVFNVTAFTTKKANRTVKIEVINEGYTINGVDYSGLGEYINMVRVSGKLDASDPELEIETLENTNRVLVRNQTKTRKTYTLNIENIPSDISRKLLGEGVLMNWIVTDYNMLNHDDYRNLKLEVSSSTSEPLKENTRRFFEVSLRDLKQQVNRPFIL